MLQDRNYYECECTEIELILNKRSDTIRKSSVNIFTVKWAQPESICDLTKLLGAQQIQQQQTKKQKKKKEYKMME